MSRSILSILSLVLALTFSAATASAQSAPAASISGTLRAPSTNAAWGTFEVFEASTTFGFFLRFRPANQHVMTVMPAEMTADGQLMCTYIEYALIGTSDPNNTQGWQWQEVAGGRVLLNPATSTATSIDGSITQTYTMIGWTRSQDPNPVAQPLRLTIP